MELNASRTAARVDAAGEPILMPDQNRALLDQFQIRRGMQALKRAHELGGASGANAPQAAIIACHAQARTADETDWSRISELYADLATIFPSPIVELNRAVAVGWAVGPEAALAIVDRLKSEPALERYHLLPSIRGDLLRKLRAIAPRLTSREDVFDAKPRSPMRRRDISNVGHARIAVAALEQSRPRALVKPCV
jgi:predicted RNA polymerase sigma factor